MEITPSVVSIIGIVLLNLVINCQSMANGGLEAIVSDTKDRIGVEEVSRILRKANSDDMVGSVSVGELLRLEDIKIYHCTKEELDGRKGICDRVGGDDVDVHRFCTSRFNEQVNFCTERFEDVVRAANKRLSLSTRNAINDKIKRITNKTVHTPLEGIRGGVEGIIKDTAEKYWHPYFKLTCDLFKKSMSSAETTLEYSKKKFAELAIYSDFLFDQYKFYELCQVWFEKYAKTKTEINI